VADFDQAIGFIIENERGYVNDPRDPGGETNFGISRRSYPNLDIRGLTREKAISIYRADFWMFEEIRDQRLATKVFDAYVNSKHHAIRVLQLSLQTLQAGPIVADGNWGPQTAAHANAADAGPLIDEFKARLAKMHCDDAIANPAQLADLLGWLRRDVKG
jgi:lysozyme family protein